VTYTRRTTGVRQQQIVEAARRIIATKGIEELTVREVAKGVGISEGDVYRHFKSKKDILFLLMDDIELTLLKAIDEAVSEVDNPLDNLGEILKAHISHSEQRRGITFIVIAETMRLRDKDLRVRMFRVINEYLNRISNILREGVNIGTIRKDIDLDAAALMFFAIVQSVITMWSLSSYSFDLAEKIVPLWEEYRMGIAAGQAVTPQ
jgi:AcrR family transcriptional regulator